MADPVVFVLGAGSKIGAAVANAFAAKGYKVALAARSLQDGVGEDGYLRLKVDLTNAEEIGTAFAKVEEKFGIPTVVVYNASERVVRNPDDPLDAISIKEVQREFAVNAIGPLFAARAAVKGFEQLPSSASRTFIMTGNALNRIVKPDVLDYGMTKCAAAHLIWSASVAYQPKGFKFYYADERQPDGSPTIPVNGPPAGKTYVELAEKEEQGPWNYTFVKDKGYTEFK